MRVLLVHISLKAQRVLHFSASFVSVSDPKAVKPCLQRPLRETAWGDLLLHLNIEQIQLILLWCFGVQYLESHF